MEDKVFELLTKMYSEFSEFRKDITEKVESNSKEIRSNSEEIRSNSKEIRSVGNQVTKLENELKQDIGALFDGYKQTYEKLQVLEVKVDNISQKIETQDVELKVLKGGK